MCHRHYEIFLGCYPFSFPLVSFERRRKYIPASVNIACNIENRSVSPTKYAPMADNIPVAEIMYVRYPARYPPRIIRCINIPPINKTGCRQCLQYIHAMLPMRELYRMHEIWLRHNMNQATGPSAYGMLYEHTFEMRVCLPQYATVNDFHSPRIMQEKLSGP